MEHIKKNEDWLIIKECLDGKKEVFAELVEKYKTMVYNLTYRMTGNSHDAEDLSQETFLHAYRRLEDFHIEEKFSTWLYTIALNLCRDKAKRRKFIFISLDKPITTDEDLYPQIPSKEMSSEEILIAREEEKLLQKSISSLPGKYREVVILRHQQGLGHEEISGILGLPVQTIKVWLHRARKRLKESLEEAGLK